jgi:hypothetical protein
MQLMRRAPENSTLMVTKADRPAMRVLAPEETIQASGGFIIYDPHPPHGIGHGPVTLPWKPTPPGTMHPD